MNRRLRGVHPVFDETAAIAGRHINATAQATLYLAVHLARQAANIGILLCQPAKTAHECCRYRSTGSKAQFQSTFRIEEIARINRYGKRYWQPVADTAPGFLDEGGRARGSLAGPQVKAVCLPESAGIVEEALSQTPGVIKTMRTGLGQGARITNR